jgi:SAM-dependent methyltransferase
MIMAVAVINPQNGLALERKCTYLEDRQGNRFEIVNGVPRIAGTANYTANFGFQWNKFATTQLDNPSQLEDISRQRFFSETQWRPEDLAGKELLEVGCGAGRFSRVVLEHTTASLWSIDYSDAVSANMTNNGRIAPGRFNVLQADIYELPFPDNSFDKVFCLGVLQHTPDVERSIRALVSKVRPGGEVVVDFYPVKGWWTRWHAKYLLRPLAKRLSHDRLLALIERNVDWLLAAHFLLHRIGAGSLSRFLPLCDVTNTLPQFPDRSQLREWAILDTFDMFSPEHDHPQRIENVAEMFRKCGAAVTFADFQPINGGATAAAVVRAVKPST